VDSTRQRQSVFAQRLIAPEVQQGPMQDLARWIERNLARSPTTSDMARHCGLSLRSFHRKFVDAYRVTPRKFIQLKRIERAQKRLRESRRSVEQIMAEIGVSDVASFRKVFQRELGCSPAEYRKRLRSQD
jgi:transcriptional regulator GlxA family with amidase domain